MVAVLYGVVVWAPGRIGYLCNGLYAVLSSGIVFGASFSKMKMTIQHLQVSLDLIQLCARAHRINILTQ